MNAKPGAAVALMTDAIGTGHPRAAGEVRIVSLVPSLTELVCELGLGGKLIGRTGFCVHPRDFLKQVAKVGGTKDVRVEAVRALEPTHLLVNIDENRREVVDELAGFIPNVIVTHPARLRTTATCTACSVMCSAALRRRSIWRPNWSGRWSRPARPR
jgi:ABC-type hemin transport system substrate-binding protein